MKRLSTFLVVGALLPGILGCAQGAHYSLTVSATEGGEITAPGDGTFSYEEGTLVPLVAFPHTGYRFMYWTGDVGTIDNVNAASTNITMDGDYEIAANFEEVSDGDGGVCIPLKNPGSFVQITIEDVDSLDPAWGYDTATGGQVPYIYETLVFWEGEKTDQFAPVLATEWELLDDNVTYRFKIREGVKFHEGGDLTAEDVEYSFQRTMVQDISGGPAHMFFESLLALGGSRDGDRDLQVTFSQIDNAVEVDSDWVVFHLSDPAWGLAFLQILCGPWASVVDKEWCIANGDWDGTEQTWEDYNNPDISQSYLCNHTNGTGPWELEEWDKGVQTKLVRNDDYWREPAAFEMIITQVAWDWTIRKAAVLAGDADLVYVPLNKIAELEGIEDLNIYEELPSLGIQAFFFNMAIAGDSTYIGSGALDGNGIPTDFFTDIDVRKGFNYAFDWETYINRAYAGEAEQRGSPIVEGLPFYNPDASMYSHDLTKAEEHLKLAWDGELWEKGFNFTLLYNPGGIHLTRKIFCEILAENLAAINPKFQVGIQPLTWPTILYETYETGAMPMFQMGLGADYPHPDNFVVPFMASYGLFAERQGYGYPELDELIEAAFKELDPAVQQDMYYEIQECYYQDAPSITLCQSLERRYFTTYIEGFYFNPMISGQAGPLYYMSKSES
jgi:peptide/nickel transport system substrate-binding protein